MTEDDPLYVRMETEIIRSLAKWSEGELESLLAERNDNDYDWGPPTWPPGNSSPLRIVSPEEFDAMLKRAA